MKCKVITKFADKYSAKIYDEGAVIDITEKRADEILKVGNFIEIIKEPKEHEESEEAKPKVKKSTKKSAKK